jgi:uncharacterized protein (TIGR02284 family)
MELNGTTGPILGDLIDVCRIGEHRFRQSAGQTHRADLKQLFSWRADEFAQLALELRRRGADGIGDGRLEPSLPSTQTTEEPTEAQDDAALLDACERSEEEALSRFASALSCELPPALRALFTEERERLQRHRSQLHSIRSRVAKGN